jgi:hypothetical protein
VRINMPIKDLIEQATQLLRCTEVSKADAGGRARPRLSRHVLLAKFLKRLHMRRATERPLRFAPVCFPHASSAFVPEAGKQQKTPKDSSQPLICLKKIGAGEGIRTLDPDLGKVGNVTLVMMPPNIGDDHASFAVVRVVGIEPTLP